MIKSYYLTRNLKGQEYQQFIDMAVARCDVFTFIARKETKEFPVVQSMIEAVKPFLIEVKQVHTWPGTGRDLLDKEDFPSKIKMPAVDLYRLSLNEDSAKFLKTVPSLFSWNGDGFLDDLCFYKASGQIWLTLTGHELIAVLHLEATELAKMDFLRLLLVEKDEFYKTYYSDDWCAIKD